MAPIALMPCRAKLTVAPCGRVFPLAASTHVGCSWAALLTAGGRITGLNWELDQFLSFPRRQGWFRRCLARHRLVAISGLHIVLHDARIIFC